MANGTSPEDLNAEVKGRIVLPEDVIPLRYDVKLTPDLERFTFAGEETVTVDVTRETNQVSFNTRDLLNKIWHKMLSQMTNLHSKSNFSYLFIDKSFAIASFLSKVCKNGRAY